MPNVIENSYIILHVTKKLVRKKLCRLFTLISSYLISPLIPCTITLLPIPLLTFFVFLLTRSSSSLSLLLLLWLYNLDLYISSISCQCCYSTLCLSAVGSTIPCIMRGGVSDSCMLIRPHYKTAGICFWFIIGCWV